MSRTQATFSEFEGDPGRFPWADRAQRLASSWDVTYAEAEAWIAVEIEDVGVREFARKTDRSPGTVSNLLRRARDSIEEGED